MEVYKRINSYIEASGLDRPTLAQRAGFTEEIFDKMMRGRRKIYADDLRAICLAMNVSPELFLGSLKNE